ncbi:dnaJ homolog subfamily C member 14 [Gouania willdenowi]|uniref:J domain-containing protein n=1 Tax=Gouania willdenowi TaxID=441366 RepID=A0A8C5EX08_GOUWI|nr:dnaJ homolog subfamily C member 14 [Gouania willdenowi]XP_028302839.1 dnaJ homolog subfamily C member 14 [Gouania willdenowi]
MEREKVERDVADAEAKIPDDASALATESSQWEARVTEDERQQEDDSACLKSQETVNPLMPEDFGIGNTNFCGSQEAKEEADDDFDDEKVADIENSHVINQEEDEAAKEQQLNGDSGWRNTAGGKRWKLRGGGSVLEQTGQNVYSSMQKGGAMSGTGRHKQTRRRNHHQSQQNRSRKRTGNQIVLAFKELLSESLIVWCIYCVQMMIEIIVTLTHQCGVCVETGVVKVHGLVLRLLVKVTDVPGIKADMSRVLAWIKCTGAVMVDKIVQSVKWVKTSALSCFRLFCTLVALSTQWVKGILVRIGGERGKHCWTAFQKTRIWKGVASLLQRVWDLLKKRNRRVSPSTPDSPGRSGKGQPGQELERLLALAEVPEDELDPFTVLGVEVHATETELKKAYRQLAVQVHPDKNKHPRAGEAFKVLRAAWDIVSNPETRREYELKRMAATELSKSMNEFLTKLQDDLKEAMNTMMCTKCEGKHKRFEMDREPAEARFCAECNRCHSAEEGDLWAESSMLGLRITYFACMDGKVFDITEWAGCQRIGISPDTHRVPYHISFGSKNNSNATRHRAPSEHATGSTNPADLQNFFERIFKGAPPSDMSANGSFFSGQSQHHPSSAGAPPYSPPTGQTGYFMPGSQRPEPGETWADGGKPPRRRKKVRKPFQR